MSLTKSAARRLSLMAGSSFLAASLSAAASLGAALIPVSAAAQSCTPNAASVLASGPGADTVTCTVGTTTATRTFNPGISYTANGDLTVTTTGPITVSTTAGGNGINLTATGSDSLTWDSTLGTAANDGQISGSNFVNGPVLDALSNTGDITIRLDQLNGTGTAATGSTHAVRAISTGGGDIVISGLGVTAGTANALVGYAGIEARSIGGGNVNITTTASGGRLYGIIASATSGGSLTITSQNNVQGGTGNILGVAGIHATTGSGLMTVTASGVAHEGTGVFLDAGGDVVFTGSGTGQVYGVHLLTNTGADAVLNITGGTGTIRAEGDGNVAVNVSGDFGAAVNSTVGSYGADFDFADLSASPSIVFTETGGWGASETPTLVDSALGVTIDFQGTFLGRQRPLGIQSDPNTWETPMVVDFTGADDVFAHSGMMMFGGRQGDIDATSNGGDVSFAYGFNPRHYESELRFTGLEEFRHSGAILFGGYYQDRTDLGTDGWYDDILSLVGTHWVGEGGELVMDVDFAAAPAADCTREAATGNLGGADCLILTGGSTEGVTNVTVNEFVPADRGAYQPDGWLLVDVSGGTSAQGHFVVGPNTVGYVPLNGGMMDKGAFAYAIAYDEDAQQHRLVSLPGPSALQLPLLADAAHELWRLSTGSWFERQGDLRGGLEPGVGGGIWMRAAGERADRDAIQSVVGAGQTFDFDNSYTQDSYAITGGLDLVSASTTDAAWTVGLMAGYATSQLEYGASVNQPEFNSWNGGIYGGFVSGPLFIDAAVNANRATMREDAPAFGLVPSGTLISSRLLTVGARAEAGWRLALGESLFAEPLASVSWSRSKWDDIDVPAGDAQRPAGVSMAFDDPTSLRAALGGRVGMDQNYGPVRAQISLLGRYWNEIEGESSVLVSNVGEGMTVVDEFAGSFSEFGVGVNLFGLDDALSGFANFGGKFGDDYQSQNLSAGVRVNW